MRKKRTFQSGFSLVELLIVITIIAIMVVIPVKMLTNSDQRTMLQQHVREIVGEINRVRYVAATNNTPYRLSITEDENDDMLYSLDIEFMDKDGNWTADKKRPKLGLNKKYLDSIELEENGTVSDGIPLELAFNPKGIQIDETGNPLLKRRNLIFSADKIKVGDVITVSLSPFGGISVTDNFDRS